MPSSKHCVPCAPMIRRPCTCRSSGVFAWASPTARCSPAIICRRCATSPASWVYLPIPSAAPTPTYRAKASSLAEQAVVPRSPPANGWTSPRSCARGSSGCASWLARWLSAAWPLASSQTRSPTTLGQQEAPLLSARNRLRGTVAGIRAGEMLAEVTVDLREGVQLIAAVTRSSVDRLGLETGGRVSVYVKATELTLGP